MARPAKVQGPTKPRKAVSAEHKPLPVAGYTPQSDDNVKLADEFKHAEERYLRLLDKLMTHHGHTPKYDQKWVAVARTHMQQANMAVVRAIFQPQRIKLPEDPA